MLVAFIEDDIDPVTIPSKNFTLKPNRVSLKPSVLPFNSENNVNLLLGLPIYPREIVSFLAIGKYEKKNE